MENNNKLAKNIIKNALSCYTHCEYNNIYYWQLHNLSKKELLAIDLSEEELEQFIRKEHLSLLKKDHKAQLAIVQSQGENGPKSGVKRFLTTIKELISQEDARQAEKERRQNMVNLDKIKTATAKKLATFAGTLTPAQQEAFKELVK